MGEQQVDLMQALKDSVDRVRAERLKASLDRGLVEADAGETRSLGSFAKYADDGYDSDLDVE